MNEWTQLIADIDRRRRAACNQKVFHEGSMMYFEGMRVALQEVQDYAEKLQALATPR